jgi:UMF1 family MFS transporter
LARVDSIEPIVPGQPPVTRREIFGWCMYDVADSAFTTVIVTVIYAPYFTTTVAGSTGYGDTLWALANSVSGVAVALLAPILGAIADFSGARKKFLAVCGATIVIFTASLGLVQPGMVVLGIILYIFANVGFTGGGIFIDSFLPGISNEKNVGRISGTKWALGYASGLVALALCLPLVGENGPGVRWVPVMVAAYYAIMVMPTFLLLKERSEPKPLPAGKNYVTFAFSQLGDTMKHLKQYRELLKLFASFLVYNEGINTVIAFAAVYAIKTVGFSQDQVIILFIVLNVIAVVGAFGFGAIADRIGQKNTIFITLAIWTTAVVVAYFTYSVSMFWVVAALAGIGMGSTQSVTRSLVAQFVPNARSAEFFGFLGISGKAISFVGVNVFAWISDLSGSQRPAILTIGIFFVLGAIVLSTVNEARGKEAARELEEDSHSVG